ncbi:MAG: glycosyltransferase family 2 protein [Alphaproteobacteria bacterium]
MTQPLLSICIPTYNRADMLAYCLENLRALDAHGIDYEIVVVDHASTDDTPRVLQEAAKRWPNVRHHRQAHSVGIERQVTACLRMGRGKFTVYVADDDKIIPGKLVEYVHYLDAHPEASVLYTPWWAYDDANGKILHGYFEVPHRATFRLTQPLELLNFVASHMIWLESGIYRSDALHAVLIARADGPYQAFFTAYALLEKGEVVFEKEPYYLEIAVTQPRFTRKVRMNEQINLSYLDPIRAGIEIMVERLLRRQGILQVPDDMRAKLHEMLLSYAHHRLSVAFRRALGAKQLPLASEIAQRLMLWRGMFRADLPQIGRELYAPAGIQAVAQLAGSMTWLTQVYVHGFAQAEGVVAILREALPGLPARAAEASEILADPSPQNVLVMVRDPADRAPFLDGGLLPGNVVALKDMADFYQILPGDFSLDGL